LQLRTEQHFLQNSNQRVKKNSAYQLLHYVIATQRRHLLFLNPALILP